MEFNKIKNGIKKIAAVGTSTLMLGTTFAGVLAVSTLDKVATSGGPFISSAGDFSSNIVLGTGGATNVLGFAEDVAGAIEIGASFAQSATASASGEAVLSSTAWEGTNTSINIGATASTIMTIDYRNVTAFAKYQWTEVGTTKNATQEFRFGNNINASGPGSGLTLNIPVNALTYTIDVEGDNINQTGDFLKIGTEVYKVTNIWNSSVTVGNISVGRTSDDVKYNVSDSKTYAGKTVKLVGIDSATGNAQLEISGDSSLGTVTVVKQQGASYAYGSVLDVTVDTTWGGSSPYAILDIVYDKQIMKTGATFFGDDRYNISSGLTFGGSASTQNTTAELNITNNKVIQLTSGQTISGPMNLFNITYIESANVATDDSDSEFMNLTVYESVPIINRFGCTLDEYINFTTDGSLIVPGLKYYNFTLATSTRGGEVANSSGTSSYNAGQLGTGTATDIVAYHSDKQEFRLNCTNAVIQVYSGNTTAGWNSIANATNYTTQHGIFINRNDAEASIGGDPPNSGSTGITIRTPAIRITPSTTTGGGNITIYGRKGTDFLVVNSTGNSFDELIVDDQYFDASATRVSNTNLSLKWDGDTTSTTGTLKIKEPNGVENTVTVAFNATTFDANITAWSYTQGTKTSYGTNPITWYNQTGGGLAANITDAVNFTLKVPQKKLTYGTGGYAKKDIKLAVNGVHNFTAKTDIVLSSVAGGVNKKAPTFAKLDSESGVTDVPVILVGGPAVNSHVKTLADANKTWKASEYPVDRAIIDYVEDAFGTGKHALVVAGYAGKDTRLAAKVLASEILFPDAVAVSFTGKSRLILSTTGVSTYTGVTEAA